MQKVARPVAVAACFTRALLAPFVVALALASGASAHDVPEEPAPADAAPPAEVPRPSEHETGPHFTFGGSVSFVFDANQPDDQFTQENRKLYADGESEESFNIDLLQIGVSGSRSIVSYGAKIDFGDWADAVPDDFDGDIALQEMYIAIDAGFAVVSAGRIPTPLGYEVLEPWANANISRSRAWYFQSVSHDGAAISGEIGRVSLMAAIVNGFEKNDTNLIERNADGSKVNNPDDEYGILASIGTSFGTTDLKLAALYSDEKDEMRFFELNAVLSGRRDPVRYGLEATWLDGDGHGNGTGGPVLPDEKVWDVTGYGGATFGHWSGDLRLSYTDQEGTNGNFFHANEEGIVSFTATGGYEIVEGVVLRAEYRVDSASDPIFDDSDSGSDLAGPFDQTDIVHIAQVQLLWTPATGAR